MGLNIGTRAVEACQEMRGNASFAVFRGELKRLWSDKILGAIACPAEARIENTAYARAIYDLWLSVEGATLGVSPRAVTASVDPSPPEPPQESPSETSSEPAHETHAHASRAARK
jgi:hypothetical protein